MRKLIFPVMLLILVSVSLQAQETAEAFFSRISAFYGTVRDYEADLTITRGTSVQAARVSYKSPNKLRLDFSDPGGQVLCIDNEELKLYVPSLGVSFTQELKYRSDADLAAMAGAQGLNILVKNYGVGYVEGPGYVPLEPGSSERVIKLKLTSRSGGEGYRQIEIYIGQNNMIRRVVGYATTGTIVQFDFRNIVVNKGVAESRFDYDLPPVGNAIVNFLFDPEDK
jgi:outer membrane lipoprotein-sorting protein